MLTAWRYGRYHVCVLGGFAGAGHLAKEATELLCLERLLPKIQDSTIIIVRTPPEHWVQLLRACILQWFGPANTSQRTILKEAAAQWGSENGFLQHLLYPYPFPCSGCINLHNQNEMC